MNPRKKSFLTLSLLAVLVSAPHAWADVVHTATSANTPSQANFTYLDLSYANGDPFHLLIVTPTWNSAPGAGIYNDHPIGVWYEAGRGRWAVFNQDMAAMPLGASFYVYDGRPSENFVVQRCPAANVRENRCYIDHLQANGRPDALLFATANWNPGGSGGVYNSHHTGVWYDAGVGKWTVFNQDRSAMTPNAAFNVLIRPPGDSVLFRHAAREGNIVGNSTYVAALADRPPADVGWFWVTPVFTSPGSGDLYSYHPPVYYNHAFGVWYDTGRGRWAIFNQDRQTIPSGVVFNVHMQLAPK